MLLGLFTLERQCECVERRRDSPGLVTEMSKHAHSSFLFTNTVKGSHKSRGVELTHSLLSLQSDCYFFRESYGSPSYCSTVTVHGSFITEKECGMRHRHPTSRVESNA